MFIILCVFTILQAHIYIYVIIITYVIIIVFACRSNMSKYSLKQSIKYALLGITKKVLVRSQSNKKIFRLTIS